MKKQGGSKIIFFLLSSLLVVTLGLGGTYYTVRYFLQAQSSCFTVQDVQNDSRCLYILSGKVYEKGTRDAPHKGNPCGTDVTSIILSFHTDNPALYLDPNLKGTVCAAAESPTATPQPTASPTETPTATPTTAIQSTATPSPTSTAGSSSATTTPTPTVYISTYGSDEDSNTNILTSTPSQLPVTSTLPTWTGIAAGGLMLLITAALIL